MMINRSYLFCFFLFFIAVAVQAQKDPMLKPAQNRALFHDYIDKEQQKALKSDGKDDKEFTVSDNEDINIHVTAALIGKVNQLQKKIESDSALAAQAKVLYLRGLERLLQDMNANWRSRSFAVVFLPDILEAYEKCMELDSRKQSIENIIEQLPYEAAKPLVGCTAFDNNPGIKTCRYILVRKYCTLYPDQVFATLRTALLQLPDLPFTDSLIKVAGYRYPRQLYDYAAADNPLGKIIRKIEDPLISTVTKLATSGGNGQLYFPFLDNIIKGKITLADIDAVKNDSIRYYKLLVKTHLDYTERLLNKDTAFEYHSLTEMMTKKARDVFVNTINGLHDRDVITRFRIIQPLNAQELYYLAVLSDGIIYTSSYTKGVYPLMMSRVNNNGDSLLRLVLFDKYRKFIKMAAGYNTLSSFLASFPNPDNAKLLMRAFVGRLEETAGLEDGVDVADSYASIAETMKPIADEMLANIRLNYQRNLAVNNKKGIAMYRILEKLFLSADTTQHIDLTKELHIPPVYEVPFTSLQQNGGPVIIQVFIYGDKDGIGVFPGLLSMFNSANWKIDRSNPQWVTITSQKGKAVNIYLNRPLPEENDEDAKAQEALCTYLAKNNLRPTVTINRGHSYNAPYTIRQMFPSSRIVFMGSCGGYNMIHDILEKAPDAHIIGTKQIADAPVNNPFFKLLAETLREGKSVEWIPFWKELDKMVTNKIFEDYVPPHKNLGAIFIKAYKIAMGVNSPDLTAGSGK
jgi:hypothetical protein